MPQNGTSVHQIEEVLASDFGTKQLYRLLEKAMGVAFLARRHPNVLPCPATARGVFGEPLAENARLLQVMGVPTSSTYRRRRATTPQFRKYPGGLSDGRSYREYRYRSFTSREPLKQRKGFRIR